MTESTTPAPKASGLQTVLNMISSPKEAFESIRIAPTWGWAALILIVVSVVTQILLLPAVKHGFDAQWPSIVAANPKLASAPDSTIQQIKSMNAMVMNFAPLFAVVFAFVFVLIQTLILMIFNAVGKGEGSFKKLWASLWNIGIPAYALGSIVTTIIVLIRGADSFNSSTAVQAAMPSLGLLALHAGKLTNFLNTITPFSLWGLFLTAMAMNVVARLNKGLAWAAAIVCFLIPALFSLLAPAAR